MSGVPHIATTPAPDDTSCGFTCSPLFFVLVGLAGMLVCACSCYIHLYERGVIARPAWDKPEQQLPTPSNNNNNYNDYYNPRPSQLLPVYAF
jgi:hypothetical protein